MDSCTRAQQIGLEIGQVAARAEQLLASAALAALPDNASVPNGSPPSREVLAAAWSVALLSIEELAAETSVIKRLLAERVANEERLLAEQVAAERARAVALREQSELEALRQGKYAGVLAPEGSATRRMQWAEVAGGVDEAIAREHTRDYEGALRILLETVAKHPWFPIESQHPGSSYIWPREAEADLRRRLEGKPGNGLAQLEWALRDVNRKLADCR